MQLLDKDSIDVLTLVVATCALAATAWQGYLARRHNILSVRPALTWVRHTDLSDRGTELVFSVTNSGVGPAIVLDHFFTVNDQRYSPPAEGDPIEALTRQLLAGKIQFRLLQHGLPGLGTAIPVGESRVVARLLFPNSGRDAVYSLLKELNVGFRLQYRSLYDENWWLKA